MKSDIVAGFMLLCLTGVPALAPAQRAETAVVYSFIAYNPAKSLAGSSNLNGGGGSLGVRLGQFAVLKAEFNGYTTTTLTWHITTVSPGLPSAGTLNTRADMFTYLFGPQINVPGTKVRPFGEALFGGANTNAYANFFKAEGVVGLKATNNGFAMALGGGFDIPVNQHMAVRLGQFDYFLTRFEWKSIGINNQSNFRYQAGLVFAF